MRLETFPGNDWPTLGVEIELQLVDARTMALSGAFDELLANLPEDFRGSVKPEFLRCYAEIDTDPCRTVAEVGADLSRKLLAAEHAAECAGARVFWAATHPFSHWPDQEVTPNARYHALADLLQETVLRPVTFGLHVHVGVPSGDAAVQVGNLLQEHLPALLALSANSPAWCGRATGLHSHRIELLEGIPTGGLPPLMRDWSDYEALVEGLASCDFIKTEKELWWDVRPSRWHGTLEVRICDMPPDLPSVLGLTALIQCLVHDLAGSIDRESVAVFPHPLMVRQNRWRAARFGLDAGLVDPDSHKTIPARQAVTDLIDRLSGVAERLGCSNHLAHAREMAGRPTGSERQLALFEQTGDWAEVVRVLSAESSLRGTAPASSATGPDGTSSRGSQALAASVPR